MEYSPEHVPIGNFQIIKQCLLEQVPRISLHKCFDGLCLDALRSKYKVKEDWLGQDPRKNASPMWKAIEKLKCVILKGACFVVSSGEAIDFWKDPWIQWIADFKLKP